MSINQQDEPEIAEDKQRWLEANQMYDHWRRTGAVKFMRQDVTEEYREDMRRRWEVIKRRK